MIVRYKSSCDDTVFDIAPIPPDRIYEDDFFLNVAIQGHYINTHRTEITNTFFSLPYPGYDLAELPIIQQADIVNLHWVANYQSPITLHKLFSLNKPVVWTLHDQWAFTGGCHYSAGCKKFCQHCSICPQLSDDPFDLASAILKDKIELYRNANLTIVSPSQWLADCARESALFNGKRVEVIPYSLDTEIFSPIPKEEAKMKLGLNPKSITVLFGAHSASETRKGFRELYSAIQLCMSSPEFCQRVKDDDIKILCFGNPSNELQSIGIPVCSLGFLNSDEQVRVAYSAGDFFVLPSLEDNLPNTMLESMSCGTPVIAFDVGGTPDVINEQTGIITPLGDVQRMSDAISFLVSNSERRELLGENCRKIMVEKYALKIQAQRYMALYEDLLQNHKVTTQNKPDAMIRDVSTIQANEALTANIETGIGQNFKIIFEQILAKALKELAPILQIKIQECQKDSSEKLEIINAMTKKLKGNMDSSEVPSYCIIRAMQTSMSWRITAPLRWLSDKLSLSRK